MSHVWPEVTVVMKEHRKELVISGSEPGMVERIEAHGLDRRIYNLKLINFLEITRCKLTELPAEIGGLFSLTSLVLHYNCLKTIPDVIGNLNRLTILDLSFNELEVLPSLDKLVNLDTLNVSSNKLTELPDLSGLLNLHVVIGGHNLLTRFPSSLTSEKLVHLHTILLSDNQIEDLPAEISNLKALKNLDLANNKVKIIPLELSLCLKMKDLSIKGNKLADRRLQKLVDQLHTKHVTSYLTEQFEKEQEAKRKAENAAKKKQQKAAVEEDVDPNDSSPVVVPGDGKIHMQVIHFDAGVQGLVELKANANQVRGHILCCIFRNLDLKRTSNSFKRFISLQNNLHDGICEKRQIATIAVHDLSTVNFPLIYESKPIDELEIIPLYGSANWTPVSARQLVANLVHEADEIRRQKKRSAYTGLHQYLNMVKNATRYACLSDCQNTVLSFPPITQCFKTKCTPETRDVLLEVTSARSLDHCRKVMMELVNELIKFCNNPPPEKPIEFVLEQVRVHDHKGQLKSVFPSSADFKSNDCYNVEFVYPNGEKGG